MSEAEGTGRYWLHLFRDWALAGVVVVAAFATWQWITTPLPLSQGPAPDFELGALDGSRISLADYGDETVVLNFWFTDCAPCRQEIPELAAWSRDHPEVPLIGISTDRMPTDQVRTRAAQLGVTYPVGHDVYARTAGAYSVTVYPTTVVVKEGEVALVRVGAINRTTLDRMIAQVGG